MTNNDPQNTNQKTTRSPLSYIHTAHVNICICKLSFILINQHVFLMCLILTGNNFLSEELFNQGN